MPAKTDCATARMLSSMLSLLLSYLRQQVNSSALSFFLYQGPYKRQDIEDWHESGFFPLDLPISRTRENPQYRTLQETLHLWKSGATPADVKPAAPAKADSLMTQQTSMQV